MFKRASLPVVLSILTFFTLTGTKCETETVAENTAPGAVISTSPQAYTGEAVLFSGSDSFDDDGTVAEWEWDFDDADGVSVDASGVEAIHVFDSPGDYTVTLTVADAFGKTGSAEITVTVRDSSRYWTSVHHDSAATCASASSAPQSEDVAWASDNLNAVAQSGVIVTHNAAFVYTMDENASVASVAAVELECGTTIWETPVALGSTWSTSSPSYHAGRVFMASNSTLYSLDASNGSIIWQREIGSTVQNTCPAFHGRLLYIGAFDTGELLAFDLYNGGLAWTYDLGGVYTTSSPTVSGGVVYMSSGSTALIHAVDAACGTEIWTTGLPDGCAVTGDMSVGDARLWAVSYSFFDNGHLYSLDLDNGEIITATPLIPTNAAPVFVDGIVFVSSGVEAWGRQQETYLVDADNGDIIRIHPFGGWKSSAAAADGLVFVGDVNMDFGYEKLYALDAATGDVEWESNSGGAAPAVADGRVYTIGADGRIYCFK